MTKQSSGVWPGKRSLSSIDAHFDFSRFETAFLIAGGMFIAAMHGVFHWPLKLPGHHGLEAMAVVSFMRCLSGRRWAASIIMSSAAVSQPILDGYEIDAMLSYVVAGFVVDFAYRSALLRQSLLLVALAAAAAYGCRPVLHWILQQAAGFQYSSLRSGLSYPLLMHLAFGFSGGLTGALLARAGRKQFPSD